MLNNCYTSLLSHSGPDDLNHDSYTTTMKGAHSMATNVQGIVLHGFIHDLNFTIVVAYVDHR